MQTRSGFELVKGLPEATKPWKMKYIDIKGIQCVIAVNEDHPPYLIENGVAKEFKPYDTTNE